MQKVINNYVEATFIPTFRNQYMRYRAGHPKHRYYLENRRRSIAKLDLWDQYILNHLKPGTTIAWDASGYYLKDFVQNLVVVEKYPIVLNWAPDCIIDTDQESLSLLEGTADNLIIININELRWKTIDYWTSWWQKKTVYLKPGANIFFSFRENRLLRNRLKHSFRSIIEPWLETMSSLGFELKNYIYEPCPVDQSITDFRMAPEITDPVNGNLKIHWIYNAT